MEKSSGIKAVFQRLTQRGYSAYTDNRGDLQNTHVLLNSMYLLGFLTFFTYFIQLCWQGLYVFACCELVAMAVFATAYYYQKDKFRYSFIHAVFFVLHINMFLYTYFLGLGQVVHLFMGVTVILIVRMFYQFKKWMILHLVIMFGVQTFCYFFSDPIISYSKEESAFLYFFFLGITMALYVIAMVLIMRVWIEKTNMLEQEVSQKEVLLAEVNHRVRNNLNVMVSLIKLQKNKVTEEESKKVLQAAQSRVFAMAEVHNRLYHSSDQVEIDLKSYTEELLEHICYSFGQDVEVDIQSNGVGLYFEQLVPLGLILNELSTNSLKYAFQQVEKPKISINFSEVDGYVQIMYKDNGFGCEEVTDSEGTGLGMSIIEMLSEQLSAESDMDLKDKFVFNLKFLKQKK